MKKESEDLVKKLESFEVVELEDSDLALATSGSRPIGESFNVNCGCNGKPLPNSSANWNCGC